MDSRLISYIVLWYINYLLMSTVLLLMYVVIMFVFYVVDKMYFKVVMVGNAAVGKTALAIVLITSEKGPAEYIPTVCE